LLKLTIEIQGETGLCYATINIELNGYLSTSFMVKILRVN